MPTRPVGSANSRAWHASHARALAQAATRLPPVLPSWWKRAYGDSQAVVATLRSAGLESVELIRTNVAPFIPRALRLPFTDGRMALIGGTK